MSDAWSALAFIGAPLAVTGALWMRTRLFLARAARTRGTIVEMEKLRRRGRRDRSYAPIVEFSPKDGPRVQFRAHTVAGTTLRRKGEDVGVLYEPADPAGTARIADDTVWRPVALSGCATLLVGGMLLLAVLEKACH
jgi:hypothetical protein